MKWKEKIKRVIPGLYAGSAAILFFFFLYLCGCLDNQAIHKQMDTGYYKFEDYELSHIEDKESPLGISDVYVMRISNVLKGGSSLAFYSLHQNVEVSIDGEIVYVLRPKESNLFGKTPGSNWNTILINREDAGKEVKVVLSAVYDSSENIVPEFYVGSKYGIWGMILKDELLPFFLSLAAIVMGIVFTLFTIFNYQNSEVDKSLLMLGMFSLNIGLWKMSDLAAMSLIFPFSIPLANLPFLTLMLVVIPFSLYVKELFSTRDSMVWYLPCGVSLIVTALSLVLQIENKADLRQTLWMTHLTMVLLVLVFLYMTIRELRSVGWNKKLQTLLACACACIIGMAVDIIVYYISNGTSMMVLGMFGFLTYVTVLGVRSVRETKRLMAIGMQAKRYEEMAYHDQLTGIFNRTAYAECTERKDFTPDNCIVVMFDLNNLKKCNDTMGHEKGDRYILCSAKLIEKVFGDIGKCYRMGGDEFCVLLKGVSLEECKRRTQRLKAEVEFCNQSNPDEFPIQIACGYKLYDKEVDYDLGDTLRRADKMMYHEKFVMKQKIAAKAAESEASLADTACTTD